NGTCLVTPGTYNDSIVFGLWRGVSAAARVRFIANGGAVTVQRAGCPNFVAQPSTNAAWTNTSFWDAVAFLSGNQFTTLQGITFQQWAPDTNVEVGVYL